MTNTEILVQQSKLAHMQKFWYAGQHVNTASAYLPLQTYFCTL